MVECTQGQPKYSLEHLFKHPNIGGTIVVALFKFVWQMDGDINGNLVPISKGVEVFSLNGRTKIIDHPYEREDEVPKVVRANDGSERGLVHITFRPSSFKSSSSSLEGELVDGNLLGYEAQGSV